MSTNLTPAAIVSAPVGQNERIVILEVSLIGDPTENNFMVTLLELIEAQSSNCSTT